MTFSRSLRLVALGTPVDIEIQGEAAAVAHEAALEAWHEALVVSDEAASVAGVASVASVAGVAAGPLKFTVESEDRVTHFLDSLSSRATLAAIEMRSGELLMLHAAGLADPDSGRVVACVAPSGTGKTTLSSAAAGHLEYVTDETVAVTEDGQVVRYPKPLSVKQTSEGWTPKLQKQPESLGLQLAPAEGLTLGAVVLLSRLRGEPETDDAATPLPRVERVELFEAILALVPELSYLSRMARPLRRLAETLARTGGARRITYRAADSVIPVLQQILASAPVPDADATELLAESAIEVTRWDAAFEAAGSGSGSGSGSGGASDASAVSGLLTLVHPLDDLLIDSLSGQALVFSGNTVRLVSAVAACVLSGATNGTSLEQSRSVLLELFGEPPTGIDEALAATLAELRASGILA